MTGLSLDESGTFSIPRDDEGEPPLSAAQSDGGLSFPVDDEDEDQPLSAAQSDGGFSFPVDDEDEDQPLSAAQSDGGLSFPVDDEDEDQPLSAAQSDGGLSFPVDDEDEEDEDQPLSAAQSDGGFSFPVDDDDDEPLSPPAAATPPIKAPKKADPPKAPGRGLAPPPLAGGRPPGPPPSVKRGGSAAPGFAAPRPPGAPPLPSGSKSGLRPPPLPVASAGPKVGAPPIPPPPGGSPAFGRAAPVREPEPDLADSGTFDVDDPFFTGNPDQLPDLDSITTGDVSQFAQEKPAALSGVREFEFHDDDEEEEVEETLQLGELEAPTPGYELPRAELPKSGFAGLDSADPILDEDSGISSPHLGQGTAGDDDGLDLPIPTDDDLRLDTTGPSAPPPAPPPQARPAPPPQTRPAPPPRPAAPPRPPPIPSSLANLDDLPAPSMTRAEPDLPAPSDGIGLGLDELSMPALDGGLDELPMPALDGGIENLPMPTADAGFDLPMPTADAGFDLPTPDADFDLPAGDSGLSLGDLPSPSDSLSFELDDLPTPADLSLENLPMPADSLPVSVDSLPVSADSLPVSVDSLPMSADSLPTPVDSLPTSLDSLPGLTDDFPAPAADFEQDLDIPDLDLDDADSELPDEELAISMDEDGPADSSEAAGEILVDKAAREAAAKSGEHHKGKGKIRFKGKETRPSGGRSVGRMVLYGVLGLTVLGVGGFVAATQLGLFGDEAPGAASEGSGSGGDDSQDSGAPPSTEPRERPEEILAKLDLDTPGAYIQALERSENDPVGQAEAALLLHLRYGPDPERLTQATTALGPHLGRSEPFVARVEGLLMLAAGNQPGALAKFAGDDPLSQLYRARTQLEAGDVEDARKTAEAVLALRPESRGAQLVVLRARVFANPEDGLAALRKAAQDDPDHLALHEALMHTAASAGFLAEAVAVGKELRPSAINDAHKAEILRSRAELASRQGNSAEAVRLLGQALDTDATLLKARIDRVQVWLSIGELPAVKAAVDVLEQELPDNLEVIKLAARRDLSEGEFATALGRVAALGEKADAEAHSIAAEAHALEKRTKEARAAWAQARGVDPLYAPSLFAEVEMLIDFDESGDALSFLDEQRKAIEESGKAETRDGRHARATVELLRSRVLDGKRQLTDALEASEEALRIDSGSNDARLLRAQLLGKLGRLGPQEEALIELHERTGGYTGLTAPLGEVYLRKGELDELDALIGDQLGEASSSAEILLTGASLRLAQERYTDAKDLAKKVLERDPNQLRAHLLVGRALLIEGDYSGALDEIERAQTREGDPEVEVWLGQALEYNARAPEARAHYKAALDLDGNNLEAAALLGRLYAYDGAAKKAIELLAPVVDQTDEYPYAHLALGLARRDLGKRDLAIGDFRKAHELDPTLFEAYYQEGRLLNDRNQHSAAAKALQGGIDNAVDNAQDRQLVDTWRRLGESYMRLGRRGDAKKAFQAYLKIAPPNAAGRREVERVMRGL